MVGNDHNLGRTREEIDTNLGRFITMVEPVLLVIMGIVIAALLLSLYMPLFNLSSTIG